MAEGISAGELSRVVRAAAETVEAALRLVVEECRAEGRVQGKLEGTIQGKGADLLAVLDARGVLVSEWVRDLIREITDLQLLDRWIRRAATATTSDLSDLGARAAAPEDEPAGMTIQQQLFAEGRAQGVVEGEIESRAAGVLAVLEARGVAVSGRMRERIRETTDLEVLDRWIRRAGTVTSAEEMFG